MNKYGFLRISAGFPKVKIGNPTYNGEQCRRLANQALAAGSAILVLPELAISAYTCGDLFGQSLLLQRCEEELVELAKVTAGTPLMLIVGAPLRAEGRLYNCGVAIAGGRILGVVPKSFLPNYSEFYEKRKFASGRNIHGKSIRIADREYPFGTDLLFSHHGVLTGIELCEDLWVPNPPSTELCLAGADVIVNLSATDELIGKHDYLLSLLRNQSARCRCVYAYSSAGPGESSTDAVYAGNAIICEDGKVLAEAPRFSEEAQIVTADVDIEQIRADRRHVDTFYEASDRLSPYRIISSGVAASDDAIEPLLRPVRKHPFVPLAGPLLDERCREVTAIQTAGLVQRLRATGCKALTVGVSGGLDSTLALLIAVKAFDTLNLDRKGIYAITMPGFGTSKRTHSNAETIMEHLGVTSVEIPISEAVSQHFADIDQDPDKHDVTYENSQARERTQILMDYANRVGAMVLGTGDLSELALGWCTYNADHISMYGVNASVPKTLVRHLVAWIAASEKDEVLKKALLDIVDTPVSPELIPADTQGNIAQKTEDLVGPYELHDFFLYHFIRYGFSPAKLYYLAKEVFGEQEEYKRKNKEDEDVILKWLRIFLRRFFTNQFKRSCLPDGPKTGSISISPRADWRMPSDADVSLWMKEIEDIQKLFQ